MSFADVFPVEESRLRRAVDYVLRYPSCFTAFEVQSKKNADQMHLREVRSFNYNYPAPILLKEHRRLLRISYYTDDQSRECVCVDDRTFGLVLTNGASMLQGFRCDLKHLTR